MFLPHSVVPVCSCFWLISHRFGLVLFSILSVDIIFRRSLFHYPPVSMGFLFSVICLSSVIIFLGSSAIANFLLIAK